MGEMYDRFKMAFSTDKGKVRSYQERKKQVLTDLGSIKGMVFAWQDSGSDEITVKGTAKRWRDFWDVVSTQTALIHTAETKLARAPSDAYVDLGGPADTAKAQKALCAKYLEAGQITGQIGYTLIKADLARAVASEYSSEFPVGSLLNCEIEIKVTVPIEIHQEFEEDLLLYTAMREAATAAYTEYRHACGALLVAYNEACGDESLGPVHDETLRRLDAFLQKVRGAQAALPPEVRREANAAIAAWHKRKSDYAAYQIGVTAKIATTATLVAGGIAGLAASPFTFGASAVLGIWAVATNVVQMIETIKTAATDADSALQGAIQKVEAVLADFRGVEGKLKGTSQELALEGLAFVTGSKFGLGITSAGGAVNDASKKFIGVEIKNHELSATVPFLIDHVAQLQALCVAEAKKTDTPYAQAIAARGSDQSAAFQQIATQLSTLLDKIISAQTKISAAEAWCVHARSEIGALKANHVHMDAVTAVNYIGRVAKIATSFGVGAASPDFGEAGKTATVVLSTLNKIVGDVDKELAKRLIT